jgi:(2R)-3-sulfolactate dehydrogenase (NADP+)
VTINLSAAEAEGLAVRAFTANRISPDNARMVARALVAAEIDGQTGHGLTRVLSYAEQARVGKVDGFAAPKVTRTGASIRVDAGTGFAYPAIEAALGELIPLTRELGTGAVGVFASHHCGQAGAHVERLAQAGLIGFAYANTPSAMAFHGGARPRLGTNPLAFAAPLTGRAPLVIDMALSVVARGKILSAKQKNQSIPADWAVDGDGKPTTDPDAALGGALLPIGGAKGASLGLMVDILCGALAGAHFSWEASAFLDAKGPPPKLGQFLIALDPMHFAGESFAARMGELVAAVAADGARLPGDRRLALRADAVERGIFLADDLHAQIKALARDSVGG